MQWSYDLLDPDARAPFDELSVWPAGFTLDLAVAMGGRDELDVIGLLDELVAKSMLGFDGALGRYRMLETLRQFGHEA